LEQLQLPDGSVELTFEPAPVDTAVQAIDAFLEWLDAVKIPAAMLAEEPRCGTMRCGVSVNSLTSITPQ
jgi:hypothetical protein